MRYYFIILFVLICISCNKNKDINYIDNYADELIDKKIKMGMNFNELNELLNYELKKDESYRFNDKYIFFDNDFIPYYEKGNGEIYFSFHEEFGLWRYMIEIYTGEHIESNTFYHSYFDKFHELVSLLNIKYGKNSEDDYWVYWWTNKKNNLPYGVKQIHLFFNERGGGLCINLIYYSDNYVKLNPYDFQYHK